MNVLLFQKTNDNKEQAIKKRKKREVSNLEEKNPKKNRVPKQGWESCQCDIIVCVYFYSRLVSVGEANLLYVRGFWVYIRKKLNEWFTSSWPS